MSCSRSKTLIAAVAMVLCGVPAGAASRAPLADAAEKMDRARIRTLLAQRVDVNAQQA